ncbi:MAG: tetratricopeptide repeat protein [Myxococcales bacterium]|nr:tetratricopeptide repeat protein [Myxococcales bacterium]
MTEDPIAAPCDGPFVGRRREWERLAALLTDAALVTVLGGPGMGKSRFLREFLGHWQGLMAGRRVVCLDAALSPTSAALRRAVREALASFPAALPSCEQPPNNVLLLDHFDDFATEAHELLRPCLNQNVCVLVASRVRLHLKAEAIIDMPPLDTQGSASELSEAAQLLRARATLVNADALDPRHAEDLQALACLLDGVPLALVIAAEGTRVLTPAELRERLSHPHDLRSVARDVDPRHESLFSAVGPALAGLDEDERTALCLLSVFEGPFSLAHAEAVLTPLQAALPRIKDVAELLTKALDTSLLHLVSTPRERLFSMLYPVRSYAKLHADPTLVPAVRESLARLALSWCADWDHQHDAEALESIPRVEPHLDVVLAWALEKGQCQAACAFAQALARLFVLRRSIDAADEIVARVLEAFAGQAPEEPALVRLAILRARHLMVFDRLDEGQNAYLDALASSPAAAELPEAAMVEALIARRRGDLVAARQAYERARRCGPAHASFALSGTVKAEIASFFMEVGLHEDARRLFEDAIGSMQRQGDVIGEGQARTNLALLDQAEGRFIEAGRSLKDALALHKASGHQRFEGIALGDLAGLAFEQGHLKAALPLYAEAIPRLERAGHQVLAALVRMAEEACAALSGSPAPPRARTDVLEGSPYEPAAWVYRALLPAAHDPAGFPRVLSEAVARLRSEPRLASQDELRLALRIAEGYLAPSVLVLQPGAEAYRVGDGVWHDLRRRPLLGRLLLTLVNFRLAVGAGSLDRLALVEAGWPGERIRPEAASNRLYVALTELRKRDLEDVICRDGEGYQLAPRVRVRLLPGVP